MAWIISYLLLIGVCGTLGKSSEEAQDVLEGSDTTLKCHFNDPRLLKDNVLYWLRTKQDEVDNVAIGAQALDANYRVHLNEAESRYDLRINKATYDRDNGMFECRVKEGSGSVLHSTVVNLTVLIPPGSPHITPARPKAIEGKPLELTCASSGGSPDPQIIWYREDSDQKLRSVLKPGGSRDEQTTSVLTINPTKDDHDSQYRCVVTSRALREGEKMESRVKLDVDYYPRIKIGPANPMRVELNHPTTLTCDVSAKPAVKNVKWTRGGRYIDTRKHLHIERASRDDAGRYICQADNGLGILREEEVTLDVLYAPVVVVPASRDLEEGQDLLVTCNVTANPSPISIEWFREDDPSFRQSGDILRINRVTAANQGAYTCRAINILAPTNESSKERVGNATISVRIRHGPGKSFINLTNPVAVTGESITLNCGANPPGWPTPRYEWRRHDSDTPLLMGPNYTIPQVSFSDEGLYSCQPYNLLGRGTKASISLKVYQAPSIIEKLPETRIENVGTPDVTLTCRAQGKPEPRVRWVKDGKAISKTEGMYDFSVQQYAVGSNGIYTVQSKLTFEGEERINGNQVITQDRGIYECIFENDVREVGTSLFLRVKHSPITVHQENKVAFNVGDDATITCLMEAFPNPSFQWFRGSNIVGHNNRRYNINETSLPEDVFSTSITIFDISSDDYGDYTCKGENSMGDHKTIIKLQPKSKPESPYDLEVISRGADNMEIGFVEGFNGGYSDTKYMAEIISKDGSRMEFDCQNNIPCKIQNLEQQTIYNIRVRAYNTEGDSDYSDTILVSTSVEASAIPHIDEVFFEELNQVVSFKVGDSDLVLMGEIKKIAQGDSEWQIAHTGIPLIGNGVEEIFIDEKNPEKVQVRLCAIGEEEPLCGPFIDAKKVAVLPMRTTGSAALQYWVGIIVVIVIVIAIFIVCVICCCRRRNQNEKFKKKAADLEIANRRISSQAPPPPYYTVGRENKGMDTALHNDDLLKPAQNQPWYSNQQAPPQNRQNGHGLDTSYSNSNNGGSMNSQDSLWQAKNAGADPNYCQPSQMSNTHPEARNYPYEPVMQDGYGMAGYGDYSHYPTHYPPPHDQMTHQVPVQDPMTGDRLDGLYPMQNPNAYNTINGDQYASVQKPRQHMDQMEGYEVSGMPDPYLGQHDLMHMGSMPPNNAPPQMSDNKPQNSFDESLESGYSPQRNRRIIREIIV